MPSRVTAVPTCCIPHCASGRVSVITTEPVSALPQICFEHWSDINPRDDPASHLLAHNTRPPPLYSTICRHDEGIGKHHMVPSNALHNVYCSVTKHSGALLPRRELKWSKLYVYAVLPDSLLIRGGRRQNEQRRRQVRFRSSISY